MEKFCEFCTTSRPVVYCKSDAAHLCLSCDAKVHSANALSNRHLRTLLCDLCRSRLSCVCCLDHRMFMCRGCDQNVHDLSSQHHQRRAASSYSGCFSAKDFAALWGFELNELDNNAIQDRSLSNSCVSMNPDAVKPRNLRQSCSRIKVSSSKSGVTSLPAAGSNTGSSSQRNKVVDRGQEQQNASFILQQILELKNLQLTEGDSHLPFIGGLEQADKSSTICNFSKNIDSNLGQDIGTNLHQSDNPLEELNMDSFTHLENLLSPSTSGMPFYEESIWQCKSPIHNNQLWSQNMQDLGVCDDIFCQDDFKMPDIDLSFHNIEELFGGDQDPTRALLANKDVSWSSMEEVPFNKSDHRNERPIEDASAGSLVYTIQSAYNFQGNIGPDCPILPTNSRMSSVSRLSAESSDADCHDHGVLPIARGEASCISLDSLHSEARENAMVRYKEKKKARQHERQIHSASRKAKANAQKRVKGQFPKTDDYDSDNANVTRSC